MANSTAEKKKVQQKLEIYLAGLFYIKYDKDTGKIVFGDTVGYDEFSMTQDDLISVRTFINKVAANEHLRTKNSKEWKH